MKERTFKKNQTPLLLQIDKAVSGGFCKESLNYQISRPVLKKLNLCLNLLIFYFKFKPKILKAQLLAINI